MEFSKSSLMIYNQFRQHGNKIVSGIGKLFVRSQFNSLNVSVVSVGDF